MATRGGGRQGRELSDRGAETRALILDTALAAFAESGFRGTSVREIAARCGLTHPALLYHFPAKSDLLMAVLTRRDEADGGDAFEGLEAREMLAHLVATARHNATQRGVVELYATLSAEAASPGHPAHTYFQRRYASLVVHLTRAYRDLARAGALAPRVDPEAAPRQLVALMDGLQVQWLLDPEVDMAAAIEAHLRAQLA
ncbi:TetR/AcrR family transcriptional regulator [Demequina iriomotensis]|uniref:TetR/AcrR family transcriptional regulator n=1 Tax=Demequina iriomotensis TaxID=1536641 RepID=UPI0009E2A2E0|nr:TetR/AcrR family transcriptional regulator [Demequina iriomotensis]